MNKQELFQQHGFFIEETDTTLLDALTAHLSGLSRSLGRKAIQAGLVKVDGIVTKKKSTIYFGGNTSRL